MKYRELGISFKIDDSRFTVQNISLEKHLSPMPKHSHSKNSFELHYVPSGSGVLVCEGREYQIRPGCLFMTGPGVEHEQLASPSSQFTEYCVYLKASGGSKEPPGDIASRFIRTAFWFGYDDGSVHKLMLSLFSELRSSLPGREQIIIAIMTQLVVSTVRLYQRSKGTDRPEQDGGIGAEPNYLAIEEAFLYDYSSLTLESLAGRLGLSKRQTERLLMRHYSKSFRRKKEEARMNAAVTLLREGMSIEDAAQRLGYSSSSHFSSAFKAYYGITPSGYKGRLKKGL